MVVAGTREGDVVWMDKDTLKAREVVGLRKIAGLLYSNQPSLIYLVTKERLVESCH